MTHSPTSIENPQKICDIYDLFNPAIDRIIKEKLQTTPFAGRRTWEFAMIYHALEKAGHLHGKASGLAMGAGKERLIFSIAREVQSVIATDLYLPDQGWAGVRTQDPQKLVMGAAPWPVPEGRIKAMAMDMRDLKFDDASFDFAWSTGAFEHIGEDKDFLAHLSEVNRVLKPGGVYAFTTVVTFGNESERIPHNYYFHPAHLFDLVDKSPLAAAEEFDCRINDHLLNRPLLESCQDFGFEAANLMISPLISYRRGILTAANLVVLRKDPAAKRAKTAIIGFEDTKTRLTEQAVSLTKRIWRSPQIISITNAKTGHHSQASQWHHFGHGSFKLQVRISSNSETEKPLGQSADLDATVTKLIKKVKSSSGGTHGDVGEDRIRNAGYLVKIFTRECNYPHNKRLEKVIRIPASGSADILLKSANENLHKFLFEGVAGEDMVILRAVKA